VNVQGHVFVDLVLGLRSTLDRFDRVLDRYAPPQERRDVEHPAVAVDLVLGAIALRRALAEALDRAPLAHDPEPRVPAPSAVESWLR
jgi:hypothetical protein